MPLMLVVEANARIIAIEPWKLVSKGDTALSMSLLGQFPRSLFIMGITKTGVQKK